MKILVQEICMHLNVTLNDTLRAAINHTHIHMVKVTTVDKKTG